MRQHTWKYYNPTFDGDRYNPALLQYSPWSGHRRFGYDYVANVKPPRIVELGSYYGCSAFTFLQAVKDFQLETEFYGIDTWAGDSFTKGDYREDIYGSYRKIQTACFSKQRAHMIRKRFDEAVRLFSDASIDLLHIDGSHTYADVKHDFTTWLPKVKPNGVIFFHDIGDELLFGQELGSHRFWMELKQQYTDVFEFPFSFGLGILFLDHAAYVTFCKNVNALHYQKVLNRVDDLQKDCLRTAYFQKRDLTAYLTDLKGQVQTARTHLARYRADTAEKERYIRSLETQTAALLAKCRETFAAEQKRAEQERSDAKVREAYVKELQTGLSNYAASMAKKDAYVKELQEGLSNYAESTAKKDAYVKELQEGLSNYAESTAKKDAYAEELQHTISLYQATAAKKEQYLTELEAQVKARKAESESAEKAHERAIADAKQERARTIAAYEQTLSGKERYIKELRDALSAYQKTVVGKEQYIAELQQTVKAYRQTTAGKERYIAELQETIGKYQATDTAKTAYIASLEHEAEHIRARIQKLPFGRRILKEMERKQ